MAGCHERHKKQSFTDLHFSKLSFESTDLTVGCVLLFPQAFELVVSAFNAPILVDALESIHFTYSVGIPTEWMRPSCTLKNLGKLSMNSLKASLFSLSKAGNCGSRRFISFDACPNDWPIPMKSLMIRAYGSNAVGGWGACVGASAEESLGTGLVSLVNVRFPCMSSTMPGPGNDLISLMPADHVCASVRR